MSKVNWSVSEVSMKAPKTIMNKRRIFQLECPADWKLLISDDTETVIHAPISADPPPAVYIISGAYDRELSILLDELYTNMQSQKSGFLSLTRPKLFTLPNGLAAGDFLFQNVVSKGPTTQRSVIIFLKQHLYLFVHAFVETGFWNEYESQFNTIINSIRGVV